MELDGLQICLQASDQAGGRFLLAAQRAGLAGRHLRSAQLDAIHLDVDKVILLRRPSSLLQVVQ